MALGNGKMVEYIVDTSFKHVWTIILMVALQVRMMRWEESNRGDWCRERTLLRNMALLRPKYLLIFSHKESGRGFVVVVNYCCITAMSFARHHNIERGARSSQLFMQV